MPTQIAPIKIHVIERQGITWQKYAESRSARFNLAPGEPEDRKVEPIP
jgi:hypothetical protein